MYTAVGKKMDKLGRIVFSKEWIDEELPESRDVWVLYLKGEIKIIPKGKAKLTDFFDKFKVKNKKDIDPFKDFKGALAEASLRGVKQ